MYKVWKYSSVLFLVQVLAVVILIAVFPKRSPMELLRDSGWIAFSVAIATLTILLYSKKDRDNTSIKIMLGLAFISTFAGDIVIYYSKYLDTHELKNFMFSAVNAILVGIYISFVKGIASKSEPEASSRLVILCSMPFGIGFVLGGILGLFSRKF